MKKTLFLILMFFLFFPSAGWGFGLAVTPTHTEMEITPGNRYRQTVKVANMSKKNRLRLNIGLADFTLDEEGGLKLSAPGTDPRSASEWISFSPGTLLLNPGQAKEIRVDFAVPVTVASEGDFRSSLLIQTMPPPVSERKESGFWNSYQVASLFYLTIPPALPEIRITGSEIAWSVKDEPGLVLTLENKGPAHGRLFGELKVLDKDGKEAFRFTVEDLVILENQTRKHRINLAEQNQKLAAGTYTAQLYLETRKKRKIPGFSDMQLIFPLKRGE